MNRALVLFLFLIAALSPIAAQKCGDLEAWGQRLEAEFPGVNLGNFHSGSQASNRLLLNLYSDASFKPVFGQVFDEMSERSRMAGGKKWSKCQNKLPALQMGTRLWLIYFGIGPVTNPQGAAYVAQELPKLRALRAEYTAVVADIERGDLRLADLNRLGPVVPRKYAMLWPSEIIRLEELIFNAKSAAAGQELVRAAESLTRVDCSTGILSSFTDFESNYADMFSAAKRDIAAKARQLVAQKMDACLTGLVSAEAVKLAALSSEREADFLTLLELEERVKSDFKGIPDRSDLRNLRLDIRQMKTAQTVRTYETFVAEVTKSENVKQLNDLANFLKTLDQSEPKVQQLAQAVTLRLQRIRSDQLARQQAELKAQQEKDQRARAAMNAQANAAKSAARRVEELRNELRIKYGANLPTFDQLYYVQAYGVRIREQTKPEDEQAFRNYVEKMGYMLDHRSHRKGELFSNNNTFRNNAGYRVKTMRVASNQGGDALMMSLFQVDDAPEDLIELYLLELTSQFRQKEKTIKGIISNRPPGDFSLSGYVMSGGTEYSLWMKEGSLYAAATSNIDARAKVYPEEVSPGTLKVTPFTNQTHLTLTKGQKLQLNAAGKMKIGFWTGSSTPAGVDGLRLYNVVPGFRHGSLLGRIGTGPWFYVGASKTITADRDGRLELIVNDKDRSNNDGSYLVSYRLM